MTHTQCPIYSSSLYYSSFSIIDTDFLNTSLHHCLQHAQPDVTVMFLLLFTSKNSKSDLRVYENSQMRLLRESW